MLAVEGEEKGEGGKVTSEVDGDGEGDVEGTAEQEHLAAAEVPPRHAEGREDDDARRQSAYLRSHGGPHHRRGRSSATDSITYDLKYTVMIDPNRLLRFKQTLFGYLPMTTRNYTCLIIDYKVGPCIITKRRKEK